MVSQVNPPPHIPLPEEFAKNPRLRAWAQAVDRVLFQMWTRTGGGTDAIEDNHESALAEAVAVRSLLLSSVRAWDESLSATEAQAASLQGQVKALQKQVARVPDDELVSGLHRQIKSLKKRVEDLEE